MVRFMGLLVACFIGCASAPLYAQEREFEEREEDKEKPSGNVLTRNAAVVSGAAVLVVPPLMLSVAQPDMGFRESVLTIGSSVLSGYTTLVAASGLVGGAALYPFIVWWLVEAESVGSRAAAGLSLVVATASVVGGYVYFSNYAEITDDMLFWADRRLGEKRADNRDVLRYAVPVGTLGGLLLGSLAAENTSDPALKIIWTVGGGILGSAATMALFRTTSPEEAPAMMTTPLITF